MEKFRAKTPKRRDIHIKVSRYQDHKPNLRIDFNKECGYCGSHDRWRDTYFEVDHFIPKDFFEKNSNIKETDYFNLVYSCRKCNNSKRAKWPSQSETIFNDGKIGFIDPCDTEYDNLFHRNRKGQIVCNSDLARWIYKELKFGERERQLELIWNLNRLRVLIMNLETELKKKKNIKTKESIQAKIDECKILSYDYEHDLKDFLND